jgi:uncharacterized protein YkwD
VSAPHKLTAAALTILSCSVLTAAFEAPAATAASPTGRPAGTSALALAARSRCTKSAAADAGKHPQRPCRARQHTPKQRQPKTHPQRLARTHEPRHPKVPSSPAAPEPAVVAAQAASNVHAAMIASVLSTPCQNTELTPEAGNIGLVREAVLCLINRKRAENGESPLKPSPQLEQAAEGHCAELIADDYFAHVSPSGETPVDRIRDTGYIPSPNVGYVIGENLAWGTYQLSTPQAIVAAWIASPGHLANILETQYTETGIGITPAVPASLGQGAPGATYAQEFGVIVE